MTERELERRAQRRLAVPRHVEEVSFNVAATCRSYGISRQCYYGCLRLYEAGGLEGLKDRSSRPHHSPRVTDAEVIEKILAAEAASLRPGCDQKTAIAFVDDVMAKLPLQVHRVANRTQRVQVRGVVPLASTRPGRRPRPHQTPNPRLNAMVERSHRIDSEEFYRLLEGQVIDDANLFAEKLQEWEDYDKYHRPHAALNGQTPNERLRQKHAVIGIFQLHTG